MQARRAWRDTEQALKMRVFDFHLDYDIMVTKEIITANRNFHNRFDQCFVSDVSLPFLSD